MLKGFGLQQFSVVIYLYREHPWKKLIPACHTIVAPQKLST